MKTLLNGVCKGGNLENDVFHIKTVAPGVLSGGAIEPGVYHHWNCPEEIVNQNPMPGISGDDCLSPDDEESLESEE